MKRDIPSLDGLRGVAVALVIVGHAAQLPEFASSGFSPFLGELARLGVNMFFVLSGFLITRLLVDEADRNGRPSLSAFYARRAIRIFPAAYLYIAVVVFLAFAGRVSVSGDDVFHAATYTMNYDHDRGWLLGHLWSLAVEEQFYLLWPLAILWLSRAQCLGLALAVIVCVPVLRVAVWILAPAARLGIDEEFQYVCDGLATGCVLALLCHRYGITAVAARIPAVVYAFSPFVAVASVMFGSWPSLNLPVAITAGNLAIAVLLLWCVTRPQSRIGQVLNSRVLAALGVISYSIYLWQQLFMDRTLATGLFAFPLNILWILVAAMASYLLVERPLMALRGRFRR
jgi:peptidoglycan/LPS O-acetylase OafA/YrhL